MNTSEILDDVNEEQNAITKKKRNKRNKKKKKRTGEEGLKLTESENQNKDVQDAVNIED